MLSVRRRAGGSLRVEIAVHQRFSVPPVLRFMEERALGPARMSLARDTYRNFFRNTIANFEAVYEGRDPLVGCRPHSPEGDTGVECLEQLVERAVELITGAAQPSTNPLGKVATRRIVSPHDGREYQESVDGRGFRHFGVVEAEAPCEPS